MRHIKELDQLSLDRSWVTIGTFDGVHLGHQHIIRNLINQAHSVDQPAVVVTFHPHPALVLSGETLPIYLTTPEQKAQVMEGLGLDVLVTHPFTPKITEYTPKQFMKRLQAHLQIDQLWIGYDFALGKDRRGTPERLAELGRTLGYSLKQISPFHLDGEIVSSSRIRTLLREGDVERAATYLGRPHRLVGEVVEGDKRGKALGFPTANLDIPPVMAQMKTGVYACYARVGETRWKAVINIGLRPTFEDGPVPPRVEAHLLDFAGDLYGQRVKLDFIKFLRPEQKFTDVEALIQQVNQDIERARDVLV
jgi:riboflavin kinase/FMN adenylyltransferase